MADLDGPGSYRLLIAAIPFAFRFFDAADSSRSRLWML